MRWEAAFVGTPGPGSAPVALLGGGPCQEKLLRALTARSLPVALFGQFGREAWSLAAAGRVALVAARVRRVTPYYHLGMNLGGGGLCIPAGALLACDNGREYPASSVVVCAPDGLDASADGISGALCGDRTVLWRLHPQCDDCSVDEVAKLIQTGRELASRL